MLAENAASSLSFLDAARHQGPVLGFTHSLYKYPARFSPVFARSAIETFTKPGEVVLDPFVGGGTTLIESRLLGRHSFGSDISSLAVFLARTKSTPLSDRELKTVESWFQSATDRLNLHLPSQNLRTGTYKGYDRNMPWRLRKICEQYLNLVGELPSKRQERFARCVLLRSGQWAMDCRTRIPTVEEFRMTLTETLSNAVTSMREFSHEISRTEEAQGYRTRFRCAQSAASELQTEVYGRAFTEKAKLILTSPPYPGVHVLYHRWNVRARRESPAPFWLADCLDGHGCTHYSLGNRHQEELTDYFSGIENSFGRVRDLMADDGLVVQVVAFSSPDWQLPAYLKAMKAAGYKEAKPTSVGVKCSGRLWRSVPGRRWYSQIRGKTPSSNELVLFHQKA